jgi:Skp family chaperone for outer membrane proteins
MLPVMLVLAAAMAWHAGASTAINTAANRPPAQPTASATVDIVRIIDELEERTVLESQLETRINKRQAQLDEIRTRLTAIQRDLDPETATLRPGTDEYKERVREFMEQRAVAEARRNALEQIISIDRGALRRQLFEKIRTAVAKIADRDGIDLVMLDDSVFPIPENSGGDDVFRAIITKGVIYRHDSIDITDRVITLMNNEYTAP